MGWQTITRVARKYWNTWIICITTKISHTTKFTTLFTNTSVSWLRAKVFFEYIRYKRADDYLCTAEHRTRTGFNFIFPNKKSAEIFSNDRCNSLFAFHTPYQSDIFGTDGGYYLRGCFGEMPFCTVVMDPKLAANNYQIPLFLIKDLCFTTHAPAYILAERDFEFMTAIGHCIPGVRVVIGNEYIMKFSVTV